MCSFGACVRDLSQELGDGFKKIFSEKSLNRRFADEMIVTAAVYIANGIEGVTGAFRDAAYTDNSKEMQAFEGQVKPVMTTIVDKESGNFVNVSPTNSNQFIADTGTLLSDLTTTKNSHPKISCLAN